MKSKFRTALLTGIIVFGIWASSLATEAYHFAKVTMNVAGERQISIITDNEPSKGVPLDKGLSNTDKIKEFLKVINQMTIEGWEVLHITEGEFYTSYILKKKAN